MFLSFTGSGCKEEISTSYDNDLIPTAASVEFLSAWVEHCKSKVTIELTL